MQDGITLINMEKLDLKENKENNINKRKFGFPKLNKRTRLFIIILSICISFSTYYKLIFSHSNKVEYNNKLVLPNKIGLCTLCKDENLYIQEFIDYYKNLGYDHIFLYDNNDINGERPEDVIKKDIDEGFVSVINYRGDRDKPIFRIYIDCYEKNNKNYSWLSFFDIDEYLVLKPKGIKIKEALNNKRYKNCQNVKFNWVLYSDDEKLHYENKPVQERFTTPLFNNILNQHVKTTVRGNLPTNYWVKATNPHTGENDYICCSSSGKIISNKSPYNKPYDYEYGYIKHYRTKSIEEYIKKIKKGKPDGEVGIKYMITMFFYTNKRTKEKMDIFRKELYPKNK